MLNPYEWSTVQPEIDALLAADLTPATVDGWLARWSDLAAAMYESQVAAYRAVTENTADEEASRRYDFLAGEIQPKLRIAEQQLRDRLLALADRADWTPAPEQAELLKRFRAQAEIYAEDNVPILADLTKREMAFERLMGGLSIEWEGRTETLYEANLHLQSKDRAEREAAWRKIMGAYAEKRDELNAMYLEMLQLRRQVAANAGLPDFRAYQWLNMGRFDYTPEDVMTFHDAIEHEVVPVASEVRRRQAQALGLETTRPWDTEVDPHGEALRPFKEVPELVAGCQRIFDAVDPELGVHFKKMQAGWLDLASRPNKAGGGYCEWFPVSGMPYIFMNAVGTHDDVQTVLHEGGHAFHALESGSSQPLFWNQNASIEFCEVASMSMELLAAPYLEQAKGGFYTPEEARRAYTDNLKHNATFLPYMAVVDAFQHYVYTEAPADVTAAELDDCWSSLWDRFMQGVDWSGLEDEKATGWHRKLHIFSSPFYYVEYGLAELGALQVWRNAQRDQANAVRQYRDALQLGYTRPLGELFEAAGARFAFDRHTVGELMDAVRAELWREREA